MTINWQNHFADRTRHISGSQIRQFFALTERPEVISFAGGFPGNEFFPLDEIADTLSCLVREDGKQALQYGPTEGSLDLRLLLAERMCSEGITCEAENIVITDGSQQGLDLLSRILVNEDEPILVEEPAYIGGMSAIKSYGGIPVGITMDSEGPIPVVMEQTINALMQRGKTPKVFYTIPNFQNPTGTTTSLKRRQEILAIASRYNLVIIEDNPYGDLCYEGEVPPCYKALDREDRVIYLGSFSKVLIPGIRIGWLAGPGQQLAYRLSRDGFTDRHITCLVDLYRQKRDAMVETMENFFPAQVTFSKPKGGFFIWVDFPAYYPSSRELLDAALQNNVAFVHGEGFSSSGGGSHSARFSFSQPSVNEILTGVKILGEMLHEIEAQGALKAVGQ